MRSNTASYQTSLEQKRSELLNRAHKGEDVHIEQAADKLDELQLQLNRELVICELQLGASILRQVESALSPRAQCKSRAHSFLSDRHQQRRMSALGTPWSSFCT